ncbi:hypothetical protein JCM8208_004794 [Rhodotorula glutinis]
MHLHPPAPAARPVEAPADDLTDDGPLFRAHIASLERRALSLRHALKKLHRALDASLAALDTRRTAHDSLDDALEDLSAASLTSQGGQLGGLYTRELKPPRDRARDEARREADRARELVDRVKGAVDRIKAVEDRRKTFDNESKRFYDELAKYLGRAESDPVKLASLDARQAERAATFRQDRVAFFSFLEGLVESEEGAVVSWLRSWAGLLENGTEPSSVDTHRSESLAALEGSPNDGGGGTRGKPRPSAGSSVGGESWERHLEGFPTYLADGGAEFGSGSRPSSDKARRRRSSLPVFGLGGVGAPDKDKEPAGKRDRIKDFFRSAQHSISSAIPTSSSSAALADVLVTRHASPPPPVPTPSSSTHLGIPPRAAPSSSAQQPRKKEGFLYATEAGQKHTTSGDAGARYHRYWITLSEGQLVEYARWTDSMQVHGSPINLLRASARISRQAGDRRFVFEVLTPELRRVYQADSDKECHEWVAAIQKSVESLLNGTSSVRHFDASRLQGSISPSPLGELTSSSSSLPNALDEPTSPRSRFPPFLSRRASAGQHSRKTSLSSKKDKRRSVQHMPTSQHVSTPPVPSFSFDMDRSSNPSMPDRSFFDASSRRGLWAFSDSDTPHPPRGAARPGIGGLGFGSGAPASRSTPDLHRAPSPGGSLPSSRELDEDQWLGDGFIDGGGEGDGAARAPAGSARGLSPEERAISDAVRTWASASAPASATAVATSTPEEAKYRNASRIAAVAARTDPEWDNSRCADCRAGGATWASWNLGVTLCIRCSGVHRSMGTHVSKVRSVELDDWSDEQLERMEQVGNAQSNEFFEARLPAGTVETLTESMVASFIREKYVDRRWAALDRPAPGLPVPQAL